MQTLNKICMAARNHFTPQKTIINSSYWRANFLIQFCEEFLCLHVRKTERPASQWKCFHQGAVTCSFLPSVLNFTRVATICLVTQHSSWASQHFSSNHCCFPSPAHLSVTQCCFTVQSPQWRQWWDFKEWVLFSFLCPLPIGHKG